MFFILKRAISREVPHCGGNSPYRASVFESGLNFICSTKEKNDPAFGN